MYLPQNNSVTQPVCKQEFTCRHAPNVDIKDGCHKKAVCETRNHTKSCYCKDGWVGDGYNCAAVPKKPPIPMYLISPKAKKDQLCDADVGVVFVAEASSRTELHWTKVTQFMGDIVRSMNANPHVKIITYGERGRRHYTSFKKPKDKTGIIQVIHDIGTIGNKYAPKTFTKGRDLPSVFRWKKWILDGASRKLVIVIIAAGNPVHRDEKPMEWDNIRQIVEATKDTQLPGDSNPEILSVVIAGDSNIQSKNDPSTENFYEISSKTMGVIEVPSFSELHWNAKKVVEKICPEEEVEPLRLV